MTRDSFLSRFTPSLLSSETLEAVFVQRQKLAARVVDLVGESATTGNKHYMLLVGPRGIGKTHMLSLIYNRVKQDAEVCGRLRIAWLREEEWGIVSFLDLLLSILRALHQEYEDRELEAECEALSKLTIEEAELEAEELLRRAVGEKTLWVLAENLNEIFRSLGAQGQMKLRAYIQNSTFFTILATSQSLFSGVSLRTSPFYGFFDIHHLEELSFENAVDMLAKIAEHGGDRDLASLIRTVKGRARIRAVHHIAAGNPRVYVIFSQFLSRETLDQLVQPFMKTLDDLTPYYQALMRQLSPQQRKIVEFLCDVRHAVVVGEVAESKFMTHQTASSQLRKLREIGYVRSHQRGRESYYELREPLMRLCLEVKKLRGQPVRLFVDFLRLWYSRAELTRRLSILDPSALSEREYIIWALETDGGGSEDPNVAACLKDLRKHREDSAFDRAFEVAKELIELRGDATDWVRHGDSLRSLSRFEEALESYEYASELDSQISAAWGARADVLEFHMARYEDAVSCYEKALEIDAGNALWWHKKGLVFWRMGQPEDAAESWERALEVKPKKAWEWQTRGKTLHNLKRYQQALEAFERASELDPNDSENWRRRAIVLDTLDRYSEALIELDRALELESNDSDSWSWRGGILVELGDHEGALESFQKAVDLGPDRASGWEFRAIGLYELGGHLEESLSSLERALEINPSDAWLWSNQAVALSALERYQEALASFDRSQELDASADFHRSSNRASVLMALGRWDEGSATLGEGLERLAETGYQDVGAKVAIVRNLLIRTRDEETWRRFIACWIDVFGKHDALAVLGQGLVRSIRTLAFPWMTDEVAQAWNQTWQELGNCHRDLEVPLRLFAAATRYRKERDERILLRLPVEERTLLEPLLCCSASPRRG